MATRDFIYFLLYYCSLTHADIDTGIVNDECPGTWPKEEILAIVDQNSKIPIEAGGNFIISYGVNGKFIIIAVQNDQKTDRTMICDEHLMNAFWLPHGYLKRSLKCCKYAKTPQGLYVGDEYDKYWQQMPMEEEMWIALNVKHVPHWIKYKSHNGLSIFGVAQHKIPCISSTFGFAQLKISSVRLINELFLHKLHDSHHDESESRAHCEMDDKSVVNIKTLVQCQGAHRTVCDFKYKNVPTWIAYGDPEKGNLIFRLVISNTGKIPCTPLLFGFRMRNNIHNMLYKKEMHCYAAVNGKDVEPHFGVWKMKAFCDGCKEFWYQLQVGMLLSEIQTDAESTDKSITLKPSILGKQLFNCRRSAPCQLYLRINTYYV